MDQWSDHAEVAFNKNGRAYSQDERRELSKRKGQCVRCGIQTHKVSLRLKKIPLTNDDVWQGNCIKCVPKAIPKEELAKWELRRGAARPPLKMDSAVRLSKDTSTASHLVPSSPLSSCSPGRTDFLMQTSPNVFSTLYSASSQLPLSDTSRNYSSQSTSALPSLPLPSRENSTTMVHLKSDGTIGAATLSALSLHSRPPVQGISTLSQWMSTVIACLNDVVRLVEAVEHFPEASSDVIDGAELGRFLIKLRPALESGTNRSISVAALEATCKLLAKCPSVAEELSNQSLHEVLLQRLESLDCQPDDAEATLIALALFVMSEPLAFVHASGVPVLMKALRRFRNVSFIQEWVSKCLYILLRGKEAAEKLATLFNRFVSDFLLPLETVQSGQPSPQWNWRAFFVVYQTRDALIRSSILSKWEQMDQEKTAMKRLLLEDYFDPFSSDTAWSLFDEILKSTPDVVNTITEPCVFSSSVAITVENSIPIRTSLNLIIMCLQTPSCRKRVAAESADFVLRVMSKLIDIDSLAVASSCMWILWNLSEGPEGYDDLTLEQVQDACQGIGSLLQWRHGSEVSVEATTLRLHVFGFVNGICSFPHLELECIPLRPLCSVGLLPGCTSNLNEFAALAMSKVFCLLPDSTVAHHAPSIVTRLIDDFEGDFVVAQSSVNSLNCLASSTPAFRLTLLKAGLLDAVARLLLSTFNDDLLLAGLDLVICVVTQESYLMIPQCLWEAVVSLMFSSRSESLGFKSIRCFRAFCSASEKAPCLKGIGIRIAESLSADSLREQRLSACLALWSLATSYAIDDTSVLSTCLGVLVGQIRGIMKQCSDNLYDAELILVSSRGLAAIANVFSAPVSYDEAHTLVEFVYCILSKRSEHTQALDFLLLSFLYFCSISSTSLVECGVIVAVIDVMDECGAIQCLQEKGCAILALLSASRSLQVVLSIVQTEGIDVLLEAQATFSSSLTVQCEVCKAMSNLSIDQEARMLMLSQGGVVLLTLAMTSNKESIELQVQAASALRSILSDTESSIDTSVVAVVLSAMESFPTIASLQESSLSLIHMALSRSPDRKSVLTNEQGARLVVQALQHHLSHRGIVRQALETLLALDSMEVNDAITRNGGVHNIIVGILSHLEDERVVSNGCRCLEMISGSPDAVARICLDGGVAALTLGLRVHYKRVAIVNEALMVFANLVRPSSEAHESEIEAVVVSMTRFPEHPGIQESGCKILSGCLPSFRNRTILLAQRSKIEQALTRASVAFPASCAANATAVLRHLQG